MRILYSFAIALYGLGVRFASLWNLKAKQMVHGWDDTKRRFFNPAQPSGDLIAWFHASSLGEFEQARPVIEQFRKDHPRYQVLVSFFSPSGYEIRKKYDKAEFVCYLPLDTPSNAKKFVEAVKPSIVFFVKYDFWFNYLDELKKHNIPTYIFSSIFRPRQYFFKPYGKWFLNQLHCFSHLFVQNQESLALLQSHGVSQCSIAGDTRFDRVNEIAKNVKPNPDIERFIYGDGDSLTKVIMAGSSWEPDEEYLHQFFKSSLPPHTKMILAPHVISENHIRWIEQLFGSNNCVRYSQLANTKDITQKILIIDNMGMLSSLYGYAHIAYIGGGWGHGIHNILEAITFGKPVIFGPNYAKFQEAHDIIQLEGGSSFSTYIQLEKWLIQMLTNTESYTKSVSTCRQYVAANIGSTNIILNCINI